jgi:3-deoxy-D-manno-octulosonate 8-phosphate phosphatase (KDO 8-P phosphatase)
MNDLDVINEISKEGLTATPSDGMPQIKKSVHYICKAKGGNGAFRDFAEWILEQRA